MEMSNKKQQIPAIRFKGFTDAWEQRKLGETVDYVKGFAFKSNSYKSEGIRIIRVSDLSTHSIKEDGDKIFINIDDSKTYNNYVINKDEIIITTVGSKSEMKDSAVGRPIIIRNDNEGLLNQNLVKLSAKESFDSNFIYNSLLDKRYSNYIATIERGNANQANIAIADLWEYPIKVPQLKEQQKIGAFFKSLDDTIALHQRQLNDYKQLKKSMLQKMFPQDGEKVPKIRFDGFTKEWEQRKLGDCFAERNERMSEGELISVTINSGVVKASSLDRKDNSSEDKSNYKKVEIGDIAYNSMRMWQGASGVSRYSGILSPAYTVIVPKKQISSVFFSYLFKLNKMIQTFQANSQGLTSDTWNLKYPVLKDIKVYVPNYEEQNKIGNFFKQLDDTIAFHQQKVNDYQQLKKVMLQQMFV